jgi:predicted PurR-regulated permease PerM
VESNKITKFAFIALLLILLYLAFKLAQPFLTYISMAIILVISVYPVYSWISAKTKNKKLSSLIVVILILLVLIIPSYIAVSVLVKQTANYINSFDVEYLNKINAYLVNIFGPGADLHSNFSDFLLNIKDFIVKSAVSIAGSVADIIIGLFIMFFVIYYGFLQGSRWYCCMREVIPLNRERKDRLTKEVKEVSYAVIYGQVLIALIEGILGGIGFFLVGISNPVFWGFIMTVLAFIPLVGTGLVWIPAGIIQLVNGNILGGIFLLAFCFLLFTAIDYFLKAKIISGKGNVHPVVGLIGVFGGLKAFGILGIIIGPIIAALFIAMVEFFYEDYMKDR